MCVENFQRNGDLVVYSDYSGILDGMTAFVIVFISCLMRVFWIFVPQFVSAIYRIIMKNDKKKVLYPVPLRLIALFPRLQNNTYKELGKT